MNPYYYHQPTLQQPYYTYGVPVPPVPAPWWLVRDGPIPVPVVYLQPMQYVDNVAILNTPYINPMWVNQHPMRMRNDQYVTYQEPEETFSNASYPSLHDQFEAYLEERLMRLELESDPAFQRVNTGATGARGSGLSEEEISKHLHVYTEQGKMSEDCEVDVCSICLDEYEKKEKMGRLECGHRFHAGCIKSWLLSKNVCPMCRATALTV